MAMIECEHGQQYDCATCDAEKEKKIRADERAKVLAEVRGLIEEAAKSNYDLGAPGRVKADTLRRFAEVFLPEK